MNKMNIFNIFVETVNFWQRLNLYFLFSIPKYLIKIFIKSHKKVKSGRKRHLGWLPIEITLKLEIREVTIIAKALGREGSGLEWRMDCSEEISWLCRQEKHPGGAGESQQTHYTVKTFLLLFCFLLFFEGFSV